MSGQDFAPAEIAAINLLRRAAREMPDELFAVGALQELACLYVKIEPLLTDAMKVTFIGAGAYVAKQADLEMKAHIQAFAAIRKARP